MIVCNNYGQVLFLLTAGLLLVSLLQMVKMSGSLEGLVKWEVSEMQADAEQNVSFEEFSSWWNMRRKFDRMDTVRQIYYRPAVAASLLGALYEFV